MAEPLKYLYNEAYVGQLGSALLAEYPAFDAAAFAQAVLDEAWEERELKQRMRHITGCMHRFLPGEYREALAILQRAIPRLPGRGLENIVFPDYAELYGLEDWEASLAALALFTQHSTSEFAVRPFIVRYPEETMARMLVWAGNDNHHVRRLASEGCRPRLPWGMALKLFQRDPGPVLPILERLKDDPSEYVRKSVANNLNDIAKDHPDVVLALAQRWLGQSERTDWIVRHGCRTLLRRGHAEALALFGFASGGGTIAVEQFELERAEVAIGETLAFRFAVRNDGDAGRKLRIEYAVDYRKANGKLSRKVFMAAERWCDSGGRVAAAKTQSFRDMTTRKHYEGEHRLTLLVNGEEAGALVFAVTAG
ncbi:DNA alkylation repair protein [Paenibacillus cymbidii]|uniref:DNA alkylation repair protein n=1 Tax=Paenibacillus cymbidii TaxID=1639034 RepID=UPI0010811CF5|nr:DNA alkylation repair protein [Paenibacillus cymbidii]